MNPSRTVVEDEILALLREALPDEVPCAFLPLGAQHESALRIRQAAVWVVYSGSACAQPQALNLLVQRETWSWSALILARDYRSPARAGNAALDLLESVTLGLAGRETSAGQIHKVRDALLRLPESAAGLIGYESVFALQPYLRAQVRRHP